MRKNLLYKQNAQRMLHELGMPWQNVSMPDLIKMLKDAIDEQAAVYDEGKLRRLVRLSARSSLGEIRLIGEAMGHDLLGIAPKTDKLGYELADVSESFLHKGGWLRPQGLDKATSKLIDGMLELFDLDGYIFAHTHYDSYSNGRFYRMS